VLLVAFAPIWDERNDAKVLYSEISPEGCFRLDTLSPSWIMPTIFHPFSHDGTTNYFTSWQPTFHRVFDLRSGELIGETDIYDADLVSSHAWWDGGYPDRARFLSAGPFHISLKGKCSSAREREIVREATRRRYVDGYVVPKDATRRARSLDALRSRARMDTLRPDWILPTKFHAFTRDEETYHFTPWRPAFHRIFDDRSGDFSN